MRVRLIPLLVVFAAGCGDSNVAPVSGRVTLNSKPLAGATVHFQPIGDGQLHTGSGSYGKTDAEGRYALKLDLDNRDGAVLGMHQVTVTLAEEEHKYSLLDAPTRRAKMTIPPRYREKSALKFTVPKGGTDQANFDLQAP
jgi:glycine/D-amino acid oxidase-like deaminating enzyme